MQSKMGRPLKGEQARTGKITIRVSEKEANDIQHCADRMNASRTDAIMAGVDLLKKKLDGKK